VTVEVEIDGRRHQVGLERAGRRWTVTIGERRFEVDAVGLANGWSLLFEPSPGTETEGSGRTSFEVTVDDRGSAGAVVSVNGQAMPARLVDPRASTRRGRGASGGAVSRHVTTAMPGRVVKLLVKPGDRVTAGQGLVVVEAMKMENELRAPADAIVREITVAEGATVEAGAILIVLE